MTQVKFNNGSIVEDTYTSESEASEATEAYVWSRIVKDLAYSFDHKLDESDDELSAFIGFLKNLEVEGESLGAIQAGATDFTTDEYLESSGLGTAITLTEANETEQRLVNKGHLVDEMSDSNAALMNDLDGLMAPTTPDGEAMPLLVASNDRASGLHTLDEAKEMWSDFLGHLDVDTSASEPDVSDESTDENNDDSDDDSDQQSVNDPTRIDGVGAATVNKIESNGFEITPSLDASEHIEVEAFDFESDTPEETTTGMPSPSEIKDLMSEGWTKEEIQDFYGE